MFWWLFYTTAPVEKYTERPLIVWLQGGPGGSSTGIGNFEILGPLDLSLQERNHSWVRIKLDKNELLGLLIFQIFAIYY